MNVLSLSNIENKVYSNHKRWIPSSQKLNNCTSLDFNRDNEYGTPTVQYIQVGPYAIYIACALRRRDGYPTRFDLFEFFLNISKFNFLNLNLNLDFFFPNMREFGCDFRY